MIERIRDDAMFRVGEFLPPCEAQAEDQAGTGEGGGR